MMTFIGHQSLFRISGALCWITFSLIVERCFSVPVHSDTMEGDHLWSDVQMPKSSYFESFGFEAPSDRAVWNRAVINAMTGKLVLLEQVMKVIKYPGNVFEFGEKLGTIRRLADIEMCPDRSFASFSGYSKDRAPLALFGSEKCYFSIQKATELLAIKKHPSTIYIPEQGIVGIGSGDQDWGWTSTYFPNRTISYSFNLDQPTSKQDMNQRQEFNNRFDVPENGQLEAVRPFLDHDKIIMLAVNQFHNITHPKLISIPLGVVPWTARHMFNQNLEALAVPQKSRKRYLMTTATSQWGPRPYIANCIKRKMGKYLWVIKKKMYPATYADIFIASAAVLTLPGRGYDTYRVFEALFAGSMPVIERGTGMDRSYHKLPVLFVDDFAMVTPALIRQAYVEALYHAELGRWDYNRITGNWRNSLLMDVSVAKNISVLMERHPMPILPKGIPFSRPFVPFTCNGTYGSTKGCGPGTHRTPSQSCAIDFNTDFGKYNWMWFGDEWHWMWRGFVK